MKLKIFTILILSVIFSCKKKQVAVTYKIDTLKVKQLADNFVKDTLVQIDSLNKAELGYLYLLIGNSYYIKSDFDNTLKYFDKSRKIYLNLSDSINYAKALVNIGVVKEINSKYKESVDLYLKSLHYFKTDKDKAFVYNNLGVVYQKMLNAEKSLDYYKKSLKIKQKNNLKSTASTLVNIGSVFDNMKNNNDSALYYYKQAQEIYNKMSLNTEKLRLETVTLAANIGDIYISKNKLKLADLYLTKSLKMFIKYKNERGQALVYNQLAKLRMRQEKLKEAKNLVEKALAKSYTLDDKNTILEIYDNYSKINEALQNYKEANAILRKYISLKDSVLKDETQNKVAQLEQEYFLKDKNQKIQILKLKSKNLQRKSLLQLLFITFLVILIVVLFFLFKINNKKKQLELQQMRSDIRNYVMQLEEVKEQNRNLIEAKQNEEINEETQIRNKLKQFDLTEREIEVMLYISKGYKNAEIAEKMFVSINTIKTHTKNIFIKLDVRNRIEASRKAKIL